jgi:hypothetical protein
MIRAVIVVAAFLPFAYFAYRDTLYHLGPRKPGTPENLIHLCLGLSQLGLLACAIEGELLAGLGCLAAIVLGGAIDEYGFHRDLPQFESDVHAKSHFALFMFLVVALGEGYFRAGH